MFPIFERGSRPLHDVIFDPEGPVMVSPGADHEQFTQFSREERGLDMWITEIPQ